MPLNPTSEALLEGASALRYKAERLEALVPLEKGDHIEQAQIWRSQAHLLARLARDHVFKEGRDE